MCRTSAKPLELSSLLNFSAGNADQAVPAFSTRVFMNRLLQGTAAALLLAPYALPRTSASCRRAEGERPVQRPKAWLKDVDPSYPSSHAICDSEMVGSLRYCNARVRRKSSTTLASVAPSSASLRESVRELIPSAFAMLGLRMSPSGSALCTSFSTEARSVPFRVRRSREAASQIGLSVSSKFGSSVTSGRANV
jgi:hypothetical protein